MRKMEISLLGICGSPIKGGNTEVFLKEAVEAAEEMNGVRTEIITLAEKNIKDCRHCNFCMRKQEEGKFCSQQDDMQEIYPRLLKADAFLFASPVYVGRLSGYLATFIDRMRFFCPVVGKYYGGKLQDKIGGALVVSWFRNAGASTALLSIIQSFLFYGIIPVAPAAGIGAAGVSTEEGTGIFDPKDKHGVLKDTIGLLQARTLGQRVVEVSRMIKKGKE